MKPCWIAPQLATLSNKIFSDKEWIFEEKFDGIRCIAVKSNGKVTLFSRNRKPLNKDFPRIVKTLEEKKSKDFVADGELVAFEGKVTSFAKLQNRARTRTPLYFYVFDLLFWDDKSLTNLPLLERKKQLKALFSFGGPVRYTSHIKKEGEAQYKKACKKGLEGLIGKNINAKYQSKRTRDWLKFKCSQRQELVIGGYTEPKGSRVGFGALLVGYYDKGVLHYAGKIGTGYDTRLLISLTKQLEKLERATCPFHTQPRETKVHFVSPHLVCEVAFTEWTKSGKLRHPRFLGLRKDKLAKNVKRESVR